VNHRELLEKELRRWDIELDVAQILQLSRYCDELDRWNRKINLTSLHGAEMVRRMIVEAAWIAQKLALSGGLLDIGSGNGSPAFPLYIVQSLPRADLVEARSKRAAFLRHVVSHLKLDGVRVHRGRFQDVVGGLDKADWVSLQGVALTCELLQDIQKIAKPTTTVVWITAEVEVPARPYRTLMVPSSNTHVFLFRLDLS
jgi:16S rRNA (guanine(527)-N(7))-methyltransferase RsmG